MSEGNGSSGYVPLEFTVARFQLVQLARWAGTAVPLSATLEVNTCFQVTVAPGLLRLAAADQAKCVTAETPAVSTSSEGTVYLPAKRLEAMLAAAPEGDVTVTVKGRAGTVTAGPANWELRLPLPDGYTGLPDLTEASFAPVSREKLLSALVTVRHAAGRDDGRPQYRQVRIEESGGDMFATATDSSQFSRCPVPGFPVPLSVPGAVLDDLVKLLSKSAADEAEVADHGPHVVFRAGPVTLAALKLNAAFPDAAGMFLRPAASNDMALEADKEELTAALRRVRISADASTSAVKLTAGSPGGVPSLTVAARDKDGNSAEEAIAAKWDGGHQVLVVSAVFLEAMLAAHPSPSCTFRIGRDQGQQRPPLLLEDKAAQVTGTIPQMVPDRVGYGKGRL